MSHHRSKALHITRDERRWAAVSGALGAGLLGLGAMLLGLGVLGLGATLIGSRGRPDGVLLPLAGGIVPLALGALLRLAAGAMRRGARHRWAVQWIVLAL